MAKRVEFSKLPVVEYQAGDTVAAYRDGQVVRIPVGGGGGDLPDLATVATTGQYADLLGKPTLGTAASMDASSFATATQGERADTAFGWGNHASAGYALSSSLGSAASMEASAFATLAQGSKADSAVQPGQLAAVATSGSYNDLSNRPTIPAAQVPADWNATFGVARILNKPTLGSAAALDSSDLATAAQGANADTAYGWGNHASAGYATQTWVQSFTYSKGEVDDLISGGGQTPSEIKTLYESNPNTNAYTDADKNKVSKVGTMAYRDATISTSDPSGGANGDVWFKV